MKIPFIQKEEKVNKEQIKDNHGNIPSHVAVIMDGNGRWATKRGLKRVAGHKEGMDVVKDIVKAAINCDIKILTLYAFSTENWRRPNAEVDFLMKLPKQFLNVYLPDLIKNNVQITTMGEYNELPSHTQEAIDYAKEKTKNNDGLLLNFAFNYGGRSELVHIFKNMMEDVNTKKLSMQDINDQTISNYLYTHDLGDPDLLIRTSGEKRISNFMLWQLAYTEFWFTDVLWPDFSKDVFYEAIKDYKARKRRFGGV